MKPAVALRIQEASQTAEARRVAARLARELSFDDTAAGKLAIVVTEAGANLVKHAGGGEIILGSDGDGPHAVIELLALDQGPGIANLNAALRDGHSTSGTPGNGLGAISRQSVAFDIYSRPGMGTALLARVARSDAQLAIRPPVFDVGSVLLPMPGETECGDSWAIERQDGGVLILVADGLGHGPRAADAAHLAVRIFHEHAHRPPGAIVTALHEGLRATRGAAVAVTAVDRRRGEVCFAGVGNISGAVLGAETARRMVSHNGTAGHEARRIQEFTCPWPQGGLLLLHSDGIRAQWDLDRYPGLAERDPTLIAGVLYRDFTRGRDDTTMVVARERGSSAT